MSFRYAFLLGREPAISTAEIKAALALSNITSKNELTAASYLLTTTDQELNAVALMNKLGGTIKILRQAPTTAPMDRAIANYLDQSTPNGKLHFALNGKESERYAKTVKKLLKATGRSVRYIHPKNSATILYNNLIKRRADLTILNRELYVTEALQPFAEFGERDYGRPNPDSRSGMLPPKLARIMINLAEAKKEAVLLDPFCGSGTIMTEALVMGYHHLIGNDLSPKAVADTKKNLDWTRARHHVELHAGDARDISNKIHMNGIDAVVTEPYLGKPLSGKETKKALADQADELLKLYIDALSALSGILKPTGVILWIVPAFRWGKEWIRIPLQSHLQKLNLAVVPFSGQTHLEYARPDQRVMREIWKLKKIN